MREVLRHSRLRSDNYGVNPRSVRQQVKDVSRLLPAQQRSRALLQAADPVVDMVHSVLQNEAHMVAVSDPQGMVVRFLSSRSEGEPINFFEGASWLEQDIGTNGIGTALAARAAVLVAGAQHFAQEYSGWTCIGVPLRGSGGDLIGALDLSIHNERLSAHTWGWAMSLARTIEDNLARTVEPRLVDFEELGSTEDPVRLRMALREVLHERQRLEEWDRRKDGALAALAHELANPLHAMSLSIGALEHVQSDSRRLEKLTTALHRHVRRLMTVIGDVGDVARVKNGALVIQRKHLDLNEVVRDAGEAVRSPMNGRGHTLVLDLAPRRLPVLGDPVRLEQVFTNLLINAAKYTPHGGRVHVESEATDHSVKVRIRDNGLGIAEEDLTRIFGEFTRLARGNDDPGGLGIGLSLVKNIVRLHGGSVSARSDGPGTGSEFEVILPGTGAAR